MSMINCPFNFQLMNEIISGIKAIKLYSWEIPFLKKIHTVRNKEIKCLKLNAILQAVLGFTFSMSPFLVTIGCFRQALCSIFVAFYEKCTNMINLFSVLMFSCHHQPMFSHLRKCFSVLVFSI